MKVVITGATGFIGKALVPEMLDRENHLILLGRSMDKLRSVFGEYDQNALTFAATDYGRDLHHLLKGVDAVAHLNGLRWWKDNTMGDYLAANVLPTNALYEAAAANGVKNVVFLSSIAVYNSNLNSLPFNEADKLQPGTHYGVSKLFCENIGQFYTSGFGLKVKSLRVGQVVGSGEREGFMLSTFIRNAASGQPLEIHGDGSGARDYIYLADVVIAISRSLERTDVTGVFNISLGKPVTHHQLAQTVRQAFGNSSSIVFSPDKPEDKSRLWMSHERAQRELGWEPKWDMDTMFADLAGKWNGDRSNK